MKNRKFLATLTFFVLLSFQSIGLLAQDVQSGHGQPEPNTAEPPMAGVHWARGEDHGASPFGHPGGSPNLTYHGGPVMTGSVAVTPIFWGTRWANSSFVGDKLNGILDFYDGIGNSTYVATNTEYTDSNGVHVTPAVSLTGYKLDTSTAPSSGKRTDVILAEVCRQITAPVSNGYYPVYVDTPRGRAGFCAWHSAGMCNGVTVQFAFFFNLDGDAGCDPQDPTDTHSQGLEALANVSGHEISEALTDPQLNAWYDSSGYENADKCAWKFGTPSLTFTNSTTWKIQGNWSNNAYNAGTGYANQSGQKGCIDGGNYK